MLVAFLLRKKNQTQIWECSNLSKRIPISVIDTVFHLAITLKISCLSTAWFNKISCNQQIFAVHQEIQDSIEARKPWIVRIETHLLGKNGSDFDKNITFFSEHIQIGEMIWHNFLLFFQGIHFTYERIMLFYNFIDLAKVQSIVR